MRNGAALVIYELSQLFQYCEEKCVFVRSRRVMGETCDKGELVKTVNYSWNYYSLSRVEQFDVEVLVIYMCGFHQYSDIKALVSY